MSNPSDANQQFVDDHLASLTPGPDWTPDPSRRLADMHVKRSAHLRARNRRTVAAVALALVFAVVPVTRAFGVRCVDACVNAAQRVAQLWTPAEPLANAPKSFGAAIGDLAPDVAGHDVSGQPVSIASLRGRVIVINFWATWCAPCRQEIPLLNDLHDRFGAEGLEVVGVSLDEGWAPINSYVAAQPMRYRLVLGSDDIAAAYGGVNELPATFVIDRSGVIVAHMVGALRSGQYDSLIAQLLQ